MPYNLALGLHGQSIIDFTVMSLCHLEPLGGEMCNPKLALLAIQNHFLDMPHVHIIKLTCHPFYYIIHAMCLGYAAYYVYDMCVLYLIMLYVGPIR